MYDYCFTGSSTKQSVAPPQNSASLPLASTWQLVASTSLPRFDYPVQICLVVVVVVFGVLVLVDLVLGGPLDQCEVVVVEAFQIPVRGQLKRDRWFDVVVVDVVVAVAVAAAAVVVGHSWYGFVSLIWVLMRRRRRMEPNHQDH